MRRPWAWVRVAGMALATVMVVLSAPGLTVGRYILVSLGVAWLGAGCVIDEFMGRRK